jgi:2-polyprenyl-3-methyl-5-hydroxy-6-metoxy-1,4-benzoquinol methylase
MVTDWTNDRAIQQWGTMPRAALEQTARDGDFAKRPLINPVLLRMLGDRPGQRVLDAGCGNGYLSRMLAGTAADGPEGIGAYIHLPNFLIVSARRAA